jgi:short-subunit dehydrogenase
MARFEPVTAKTQLPLIWITGASSGIGLGLVKLYVQRGYFVIASARGLASLRQLAQSNANIYPLSVDVCDEQGMLDAATQIKSQFGDIDKCIINAGVCDYVEQLPVVTLALRNIMQTNFFGAVNTANAALSILKEHGQLVAVASQVQFAAFPKAEMYGASKAALDYFFRALRLDLQAQQIDVSIIFPGFVKTPLTDKNTFSMPFLVSCEQAVEKMYKAIEARKRVLIFPKRLYYLLKLSQYFPRLWDKALASGAAKAASKKS